jgi:hypothetical protein
MLTTKIEKRYGSNNQKSKTIATIEICGSPAQTFLFSPRHAMQFPDSG